jgi:hypothetical protein
MKKSVLLVLILIGVRPLLSQELTVVKKDGSVLRFDLAAVDSVTFSTAVQPAAGGVSDETVADDSNFEDDGPGFPEAAGAEFDAPDRQTTGSADPEKDSEPADTR